MLETKEGQSTKLSMGRLSLKSISLPFCILFWEVLITNIHWWRAQSRNVWTFVKILALLFHSSLFWEVVFFITLFSEKTYPNHQQKLNFGTLDKETGNLSSHCFFPFPGLFPTPPLQPPQKIWWELKGLGCKQVPVPEVRRRWGHHKGILHRSS